jgi:hypothetical protein
MHGGVSRREFAGAGGVRERASDQNIYYTVFSLSLFTKALVGVFTRASGNLLRDKSISSAQRERRQAKNTLLARRRVYLHTYLLHHVRALLCNVCAESQRDAKIYYISHVEQRRLKAAPLCNSVSSLLIVCSVWR